MEALVEGRRVVWTETVEGENGPVEAFYTGRVMGYDPFGEGNPLTVTSSGLLLDADIDSEQVLVKRSSTETLHFIDFWELRDNAAPDDLAKA